MSMENEITKKQKSKFKMMLTCFGLFFKIGMFTFGGGFSIIAQLEQEFADLRGWITKEEILDMLSVARSLPGIMVINISVLIGYRLNKALGAVVCAVALAAPSVIVLSIITLFYNQFAQNIYVQRAMTGVRASVVPIIISAALSLKESAVRVKAQYLISAVGFLLCLFTGINNLLIVLLGAAVGLILKGGDLDGAV